MKVNWIAPFQSWKAFLITFVAWWATTVVLLLVVRPETDQVTGLIRLLSIPLSVFLLAIVAKQRGASEPLWLCNFVQYSGIDEGTIAEEESISLSRCYEVLQITPNCENEVLRAAYKQHLAKWHPDRMSTAPEEMKNLAAERLREINLAYDHICRSRRL